MTGASLPGEFATAAEGDFVHSSFGDSVFCEPDDPASVWAARPFADFAALVSKVPDLATRLATWPIWREHVTDTEGDVANGFTLDCSEPEYLHAGETVEEWTARVVANPDYWWSSEDCIAVAPGGFVAQWFRFSDMDYLWVFVVVSPDGTVSLFSFGN